MPKWIQDPKTGKLIPASDYVRAENKSPYVHGDIDAFVSPIDGSVISDRAHLRAHNTRHGVTNVRDYGDKWFERKAKERQSDLRGDTQKAKTARVNDIQKALQQHGL